jgi:hypothetical protein
MALLRLQRGGMWCDPHLCHARWLTRAAVRPARPALAGTGRKATPRPPALAARFDPNTSKCARTRQEVQECEYALWGRDGASFHDGLRYGVSVAKAPALPLRAAIEPARQSLPERTRARPAHHTPPPPRAAAVAISVVPPTTYRTQPLAPANEAPNVIDPARISPEQVARVAVEQDLNVEERASDRTETARHALTATLSADALYTAMQEKRNAPRLRPKSDGSYVWKGEVLSAAIAADGTVKFKDPALFAFDGFAKPTDGAPTETEELGQGPGVTRAQRMQGGIVFRFDVMDLLVSALNKENYSAERRWFLDQTAELRERMAMRHQLCGSSDQRPLRNYLATTIVHDAFDVTSVHDAIFTVFDACAGSAYGPAAVATIFAFIRTQLPQGTARAYAAADVAKLNEHRTGRVLFEPYAQGGD